MITARLIPFLAGRVPLDYQVIVIGGGLAGATLATALAQRSITTLVLERETDFKDRVRGEQVHAWGAFEARKLGIYDLIMKTCGHEVRHIARQVRNAPPSPVRNILETSPYRLPLLNFYHPVMQTVLLAAAEEAGATVRRGTTVAALSPGNSPSVHVRESDGRERQYQARLIVGADGRNSRCRRWGGFEVHRDPECVMVAGVLLENVGAPKDALSIFVDPSCGRLSIMVPLGDKRFRTYVMTHKQSAADRHRFSGEADLTAFLEASVAVGAPRAWFENVMSAGPLASFEGADTWVEHPYREGIVLIGDAAASNDPSFGCGLSLSLRDVRVLSEQLLAGNNWEIAANAYAIEHDRYYGAIHRLTGWARTLLLDPSSEAGLLRRQAFPRFAEDPTRAVDFFGVGPEFPSDENARRRYFGEA